MASPVLDGLRSSRKGNLTYDTHWYEEGRIYDIVEECTSPPSYPREVVNVLLNLSTKACLDQTDSRGSLYSYLATTSSPLTSRSLAARNDQVEDSTDKVKDKNEEATVKGEDAETEAYYKRTGEVEVSILQCEQQWDDMAKESVKHRQKEYEAHSKMLTDRAEHHTSLLAQQYELKNRAMMQTIHQVAKDTEQTRQKRLTHQQERQRLHAKRMDSKMRAAHQAKEKAEEVERQRRSAELKAHLESMIKIKHEIDEVAKWIVGMMDDCPHKAKLPDTSPAIRKKVDAICKQADNEVQKVIQQGTSLQRVPDFNPLLIQMLQCQELTGKVLAEAARLGEEEAASQKTKEAAEQAAAAAKQKQEADKQKAVQAAAVAAQVSNKGDAALGKFVSPDALKVYESVNQKLAETVQTYHTLKTSTDAQVKKFRNDIMKAVNTPVNAVSVQSGRQLLDQLRRLTKLLSGDRVEIAGGKLVSIAAIPSGKAYCQETLARKLVAQCDRQISSNHETAFPFAAITVALWRDFPEVKELMLAHFYKGCPFLLPYYIPKQDNQSTEEYYKALGYIFGDDGKVEAQDKYLKRLSGYMRLYSAIIATKPLQGGSTVHPHGPSEGWMWLSRVMNLEPLPDVTATMLLDFLEVCGHTLANSYGKQFFKLIQTLCRHYFTKIEAVTPKGSASGGPVLRLKSFLETVIKTQKISPPKGLLSTEFWRS